MQFMFGVGGYIIARVLAILLPLFFVNQPGQEDLAIRIVLILENIVLWAFLGALAYIFRSPYSLYSHALCACTFCFHALQCWELCALVVVVKACIWCHWMHPNMHGLQQRQEFAVRRIAQSLRRILCMSPDRGL